jgi:hypothetical protein
MLKSLEPAAPAVPTAAADEQHHDDDDDKSCVVHIVLPMGSVDPSKSSEECDEILLLVGGQLRAKDQVEKLDRVFQRQQTTSCMYGGESLTPRSGNVLIGPSPVSHRPLIIAGLKKRSILRSCIRLSV